MSIDERMNATLMLSILLGVLLTGCSGFSLLQTNPLIGKWIEISRTTCDLHELNNQENRIGELHFKNGREFSVTWRPFESYRDYWGTYTHDPTNGSINFSVTNGNYLPENFDGQGQYLINDEGRLILKNIFLGNHTNNIDTQPACNYEFSRYD